MGNRFETFNIYASKLIFFFETETQEAEAALHVVVGGVRQCAHPPRLRHDRVRPPLLGPLPPPPVQCYCPCHSPHYAPAVGGTSQTGCRSIYGEILMKK